LISSISLSIVREEVPQLNGAQTIFNDGSILKRHYCGIEILKQSTIDDMMELNSNCDLWNLLPKDEVMYNENHGGAKTPINDIIMIDKNQKNYNDEPYPWDTVCLYLIISMTKQKPLL
jgi:hypothetical protein